MGKWPRCLKQGRYVNDYVGWSHLGQCTTEIYAISEYSDSTAIINFLLMLCFLLGHKAKCFAKSSKFSDDIRQESKTGTGQLQRWVGAEN